MIEKTALDSIQDPPVASLIATPAGAPLWQRGLPRLSGALVTLRELRLDDAAPLVAAVGSEEVARLISPPPDCVAGMERFIQWSQRQRECGESIAFAVEPKGFDTAVGLFQVRALDYEFVSAEWGFALSSEFWGTGVFTEAARLVVEFAFDVIGIRRLEARAVMGNGRGNGALYKLGAVQEALLRRSFLRHGEYYDQVLWVLDSTDRRDPRFDLRSATIH